MVLLVLASAVVLLCPYLLHSIHLTHDGAAGAAPRPISPKVPPARQPARSSAAAEPMQEVDLHSLPSVKRPRVPDVTPLPPPLTTRPGSAAEPQPSPTQPPVDGDKAVRQRHTERGRLVCDGREIDSEIIYWRRVPGDWTYESPVTPHHDEHHEKYITFQYDAGGWNNIRMGMEILIVVAHAMGRTVVMPPPQRLYLLGQAHHDKDKGKTVKAPTYGFEDFFNLETLRDHEGFHLMSMSEFLRKEGVTGGLGGGKLPPGNRTDVMGRDLWSYLTSVADVRPAWAHKILAIPSSAEEMKQSWKGPDSTNADAQTLARFARFKKARDVVLYNQELQAAKHIHFQAGSKTRLLQHHYAFTFFEDPHLQSFYKRFIRDFMRYKDEIQCIGAELVAAVRADARAYHAKRSGNASSTAEHYVALHVRRGDFQFKKVKVSAEEIVRNLNNDPNTPLIPPGSLVYVSTDDPKGVCRGCTANRKPCPTGEAAKGLEGCMVDPSWDAFRKAGWELRFLDDFLARGHLKHANPNYHGMVESIVCARADLFAGTFFSTFTGYIHRLRGYHGLGEQTYYHSPGRRNSARDKESIGNGFSREYRYGWTDDGGGLI